MKRVIAVTLLLCAGLWCLAQAQEGHPVGPNPTAVGTAAVGQIPGTATNDSASAGNVGEIIASVGGLTTGTVTFTNGSAVIADAQTCATNATTGCIGIGNVLHFTTSGSLPTNFSTGTIYYVSATGFTPGTSYEVATTPTGTPIVAGSAGSGTQTRANSTIGNINGNFYTVASAALTAGQWFCTGWTFHTFSSATATIAETLLGTTANSSSGAVNESIMDSNPALSVTSGQFFNQTNVILKLASTTQYYLNIEDVFSAGSVSNGGSLLCTRVR